MDMLLSIVTLTQERYDAYVSAMKDSNLPPMIREELVDLLETALQQTQQAKNMGWIS